jgi:hypothetical protein
MPLRQIRATLANEIPSSAAMHRVDQRVIPSRLGGRPSLTSVATATLISSISAGRAGLRLILQDGDPACGVPIPPADHGRAQHLDRPGDLRVRHPVRD